MNNKGTDQTAQADLQLCCSHMAKTGFLMTWLQYIFAAFNFPVWLIECNFAAINFHICFSFPITYFLQIFAAIYFSRIYRKK